MNTVPSLGANLDALLRLLPEYEDSLDMRTELMGKMGITTDFTRRLRAYGGDYVPAKSVMACVLGMHNFPSFCEAMVNSQDGAGNDFKIDCRLWLEENNN